MSSISTDWSIQSISIKSDLPIFIDLSIDKSIPIFIDWLLGFQQLSMKQFSEQIETIRTLSKDDDDGSENVVKKWICVLSNLIASIWILSISQIQATFLGVEFSKILFRFKKRKENPSSYVHVLHKTSN